MAFVKLPCVPRESCFLHLQFVVEVEEKTTFFDPLIYLLDIAKVNFSVIILNSGFRIPDSGFRFPDSGFRIPAFRVALNKQPSDFLFHQVLRCFRVF